MGLEFLGKFHPVAVHFPIALIVLAAVMELMRVRVASKGWRDARSFVLCCGALGAVVSAVLGWIHAGHATFTDRQSEIVFLHRWLGVTTAVSASFSFIFLRISEAKACRLSSIAYRVLLMVAVVTTGVGGHYGGLLVFGEDYYSSARSAPQEVSPGGNTSPGGASYGDVQALFEARCYQCHGPERQKGELRLDSHAVLMQGGKSGAVVIPHDADASLLVQLIGPPDHAMPARGGPLSAREIARVRSWVQSGAMP